MKTYKGIIKKVPTEKHFEDYENGLIEMSDIRLAQTVVKFQSENGEFEALPIKLSYQDVDENGNEKYTYDESSDCYIKSYKTTPVIYATGKEMRILIELGEYAPVKIIASENEREGKVFLNIECVQNQHMGLA